MKTDKQYKDSARTLTYAFIGMVVMIVIALLASCGTAKTVTEKVVKEIDSTAIVSLQTELSVKNKIIENLQTDLNRMREENTRLLSESSSHTINYDTNAPVNPETGEYPKASETKTHTKSEYDRAIKENETLKQEHKKEVETIEEVNSNLEMEVKVLRQENSELKTKTVPVFNFKSFLWGMLAGAVILLVLIFFVRR